MDLVDDMLVLIKRVLQAIPINWTTLASITIHTVSNSTSPQITVEVNQRSKGYGFGYLGNLGLIKGYWRLGMKHPNTLAKALVANGTRKLINRKGLWQEILLQKYIAPASLEEWLRKPWKKHQRGSNFWKDLSQSTYNLTYHLY